MLSGELQALFKVARQTLDPIGVADLVAERSRTDDVGEENRDARRLAGLGPEPLRQRSSLSRNSFTHSVIIN